MELYAPFLQAKNMIYLTDEGRPGVKEPRHHVCSVPHALIEARLLPVPVGAESRHNPIHGEIFRRLPTLWGAALNRLVPQALSKNILGSV